MALQPIATSEGVRVLSWGASYQCDGIVPRDRPVEAALAAGVAVDRSPPLAHRRSFAFPVVADVRPLVRGARVQLCAVADQVATLAISG
jgi:hypothetical protein